MVFLISFKVWSAPRPEYKLAPRLRPEEDANQTQYKQLRALFRNTGKDPRFNHNTKVYYKEDTFFGNLGPNDPPVSVNTYHNHVWNIKVDGETLQTFVISEEEQQEFEV